MHRISPSPPLNRIVKPPIKSIFSSCPRIAGFLVLLVLPAQAITVQELNVNPNEIVTISVTNFYTGGVYAGVNKLLVGQVAADGFCIDPFHFSLSSSPGYQFVPLAIAPKPPGTMGPVKAAEIGKLWAMDYSSNMSAEEAAGLQIAIWEIVGGASFSISGNDFGASSLLQNIASYHGNGARLIALSGPGQDYVIQRPSSVPDGGATITLFALALLGLAAVGVGTTRNSHEINDVAG